MRLIYLRYLLLSLLLIGGHAAFAQSKSEKSTAKSATKSTMNDNAILEKRMGEGTFTEAEIRELRKQLKIMRLANEDDAEDDEGLPWVTISGEVPETNRFGNALFTNRKMSFAPRLDIAAPRNYTIGPGDAINIAVYGVQELDVDVPVSSNGSVHIPYAGTIQAGGVSIETLENRIRLKLIENGFQSLKTGLSNLSVTVAKYRSILVTVVGAHQSGNYVMPSIATVFHALHMAGGPDTLGSYRTITLVRDNRVKDTIDLYDFLLHGKQSANITLRDNDVIVIPVSDRDVEVEGGVKQPLVFELLPQETMTDLLRFAGGYTANAHRGSVDVRRYGNGGVFISSYSESDFDRYVPQSGDVVVVKTVRNTVRNAVYTAGAVERSGTYGYEEGLTLRDLLNMSGGVRESALMSHGVLYRYRNNHQSAYLNFVPKQVLEGATNFNLQEGDSVVIANLKDMFPRKYVEVRGQVLKPGRFYHAEGMTVRDALLLAGGLSKRAVDTVVEVYRQTKSPEGMVVKDMINVTISPTLDPQGAETLLHENDLLVVREDKQKRTPYTVYLEGEATNTGPYMLLNYEERLSSLLLRSGGITDMANPNGVFVVRNEYGGYVEEKDFNTYNDVTILKYNEYNKRRKATLKIVGGKDKNQALATAANEEDYFEDAFDGAIDAVSIISVSDVNALMRGTGKGDVILKDGDRIIVQPNSNTIRVKGEVNSDVVLSYMSSDLRVYIDKAGGLKETADKRRIFVIEPNGQSKMSTRFFWNTHFPKVKPGSIVVVPSKLEKLEGKTDPARVAAAASIGSSTLGVLFLIFSLVR